MVAIAVGRKSPSASKLRGLAVSEGTVAATAVAGSHLSSTATIEQAPSGAILPPSSSTRTLASASSSRIVIKNLPREVDEAALIKFLGTRMRAGMISGTSPVVTDCHVVRKKSTQASRMFAFVGFKNEADAEAAVKDLNCTFFNTKKISVELAYPEGSDLIPRAWSAITQEKQTAAKKDRKRRQQNGTSAAAGGGDETSAAPAKKRRMVVKFLEELEDFAASEINLGANDDKQKTQATGKIDELLNDPQRLSIRIASDTGRLRLINIPYDSTEDDVRKLCEKFGPVSELQYPIAPDDPALHRGFAFVSYTFPQHAMEALDKLNSSQFQGRYLRAEGAVEFDPSWKAELAARKVQGTRSKVKQMLEARKRERNASKRSWNLLYVSGNVAVETTATALGVSKEDILDDVNASDSLPARVAISEALVTQRVKEWLDANNFGEGDFLRDSKNASMAFNPITAPRSDDTLLIKHLPLTATAEDLREMFSRFGSLDKFTMSPTKTVALVTFVDPGAAQRAFSGLLLKNYNGQPLYLEWAPKSLSPTSKGAASTMAEESDEVSAAEGDETASSNCLFVTNLSFETTAEAFEQHFNKCLGYRKATIAESKREVRDLRTGDMQETRVSRGFGFVEFDSMENTQLARKRMAASLLDGRLLRLQLAQGAKAAKTQAKARAKLARKTARREEKKAVPIEETRRLMVKNVPFGATAKDIRQLVEAFCAVTAVRLPKKRDGSPRGYAFVDFASRADAQKALELLGSVHLLGRHLVFIPTRDETEE